MSIKGCNKLQIIRFENILKKALTRGDAFGNIFERHPNGGRKTEPWKSLKKALGRRKVRVKITAREPKDTSWQSGVESDKMQFRSSEDAGQPSKVRRKKLRTDAKRCWQTDNSLLIYKSVTGNGARYRTLKITYQHYTRRYVCEMEPGQTSKLLKLTN